MSRMNARDLILGRLRAANVCALSAPDPASYYAGQLAEDLPARVERLALNLSNAMASVHRTALSDLACTLERVIAVNGLREIAVGPEILTDAALCASLSTTTQLLPVTIPRESEAALFDRVHAGLTRSYAAIAETGTVVLWCDEASPRLLSLVPPVHIVIVDAHRTFNTLFDLMQRERWSDGLPTNVVLVSSPSKTADIQQTLAYGAHGPKQLIVILVEHAA
jgi:L-lactate dehydrogenase complex protein LldG